MKIVRKNLHKLFLCAVASFGILVAVSCSNTKDPAYYNSAYPPVAPRSRYYSNPYAIPAYSNYDSDYYYSAPNYANSYEEQQRDLEEARAKSAGVADEK